MNWSYRNTVLVLCTLAFFVTMVARLAISPVVPLIISEFEISKTLMGGALTGIWLAYAVTQFPSGVLADRYGEKLIILVSLGGTAIMSFFMALAPVFSVFVLCAVMLGAAAGLHYSVATTLLSHTYDEMGTAVGLHTAGAPLAGLTAPVVAAWVGVRYGWRPAVALTLVVAIPVFVLFRWEVRPTEPRRPDLPMRERFKPRAIFQLLSQPPVAFTVFIAATSSFVAQGVFSFLPTFLVEYHDYTPTLASAVFSLYFVVLAGAQVVAGALSDRYGRDFTIAVCMTIGIVGFALFVARTGLVAIVVAAALIGIGTGNSVAIQPRFLDELSEGERGAGFGLVRTVYMIIGSLGSVAVGLFADLFGWSVSFGFLAMLFLVAFCTLGVNWFFDLGY